MVLASKTKRFISVYLSGLFLLFKELNIILKAFLIFSS